MYIDLGLVNALPSEILVHGPFRNSLIIQIRVFRNMKSICLSRVDFQKHRTTATLVSDDFPILPELHLPPRPPKYHKHFSTLDEAIETSQSGSWSYSSFSQAS